MIHAVKVCGRLAVLDEIGKRQALDKVALNREFIFIVISSLVNRRVKGDLGGLIHFAQCLDNRRLYAFFGVFDKSRRAFRAEFFDRLHQPDIALLNQIRKRRALPDIIPRYVDDQPQVRVDQFNLSVLVAVRRPK